MYEIEMKKEVLKFILSLKNSNGIIKKIKMLKYFKSNLKLNLDIKRLQSNKINVYRLRIGKMRFIFEIVEDKILVKSADYRGNIYN